MTSAVCTSAREPPCGIQKLSVIPGALPGRSLSNVERNTVGRSAKLVCQPLLLEVGKTLRHLGTFDGQSFRVLPSFQGMMIRHTRRIDDNGRITESFHFIPYPVYASPRCVCSLVFACPRLAVRQF